jgi:hypothetical protein
MPDPNARKENIALTILLVGMLAINLFLVWLAVQADDTIVASYLEESR